MMNIYQKLMKTRVEFHQLKLEKSGHNKFANFKYFELADFLVPATEILERNGLCPIIQFTDEMAKMLVVNTEKSDEIIEFMSPMRELELKGANAIQNLGGVQTYLTRYLYIQLLNIVENDVFDATSGQSSKETKKQDKSAQYKATNDYKITDAQLRDLWELGRKAGQEPRHIMERINKKYKKNASELKKSEYDVICSVLEKEGGA